jgi:hypothetical protein
VLTIWSAGGLVLLGLGAAVARRRESAQPPAVPVPAHA